jgi:hypothetical protein
MRIQLRAILPLLALSCVASTAAEAQIGFPGSVRRSPRPLVDDVRSPGGAGVIGDGPQLTLLLGSAGNASDAAAGFSGMGGFKLENTPITVEGTLSYGRNIPDELDATNAFGATMELGLKHLVTKDTLEFAFGLNGEAEWEDRDAGYKGGLSASVTFLSLLELGTSLTYGGSVPNVGDATWAFVPGVAATFYPTEKISAGIDYTFENDLDGEDSYEFVATYDVTPSAAPPFRLSAGINSDTEFNVGIIFEF